MLLLFFIISIVMLALAVGLRFYVARRRFYRNNAAGVQEFKSYGHMLKTTWFENLIEFFSIALIVTGLIILVGCSLRYFGMTHHTRPVTHNLQHHQPH